MKIGFTTIRVKDMEESLKFYTELLELKEVSRFSPQKGVDIVFLKDEDNNMIELIKDSSADKLEGSKAASVVSIGFKVNSLNEIVKKIKSKNIKILRGPIEVPSGERFIFIKDPNGVEIEFIEGFQLK